MTKSSGPPRRSASAGAGSGVAANLRLVEYSVRLSFATADSGFVFRLYPRGRGWPEGPGEGGYSKDVSFEAPGRCKRLFLQGMEGKLLSAGHQTGGDARVVRGAPA